MYDIVVEGGTVVTASGQMVADVGIESGRVIALSAPGTLHSSREQINARGKYVLPGLVDAHVHLRDPGFTHKEDFRTGTMAAAAGGVTTVLCMPNTDPPLVNAASIQGAVAAAEGKAVVDYGIYAGASMGHPDAIAEMSRTAAIGFDMHGDPYPHGTGDWIELLERVNETGLPLAVYVNDAGLRLHQLKQMKVAGRPLDECWTGSFPGMLEVGCIGRVFSMAAILGTPIVLRAVTSPEGLALVRHLRSAYPRTQVTVEACVPYLFLDSTHLQTLGSRAIIIPPLRKVGDAAALWAAIRDGTVDFVATDHAPHSPSEKEATDLLKAPPGVIGLETFLPLLLNASAEELLSMEDIARLTSEVPARTFGLFPRKGTIAIGSDADIVIVDREQSWRIDAAQSYSLGAATPFDGWEVQGKPVMTLVRGRKVMENGIVDSSVKGLLLTPDWGQFNA